jgi:hypothetical protein
LGSLKAELAKAKKKASVKALDEFHTKIASLKFLDPACGCGNFLIIACRELRRLEHQALSEIRRIKGETSKLLSLEMHLKVGVEQFYGIEILSWPCQIAKTGLWLMDHLMNMEASEEFGNYYARLPLKKEAVVVNGNAHRMDWESIVPKNELSYILGNPPFGGARTMNSVQKEDMHIVFNKLKGVGNLDYVTAWYKKATDMMVGSKIQTAYVSTNSITQGQQVALLWKPLIERGIYINFGIHAFKWTSEAPGKAAVHCVIVGFSYQKTVPNINPYLSTAPTVFIESRNKAICDAPEMGIGNKPIDGGNFLFTEDEMKAFIANEPSSSKYFRKWVGADEFINGYCRHFLFLRDCSPHDLRKMPESLKRIEAVRKIRQQSKSEGTRKIAETPLRFHVENMPETTYIVVPEISSENRHYIPIGFLGPETLVSNSLKIAPNATLYHFGILTSNVHMAWVRAVCGRLEMRYCYSVNTVYNNFPWPDAIDKQKAEIEKLAQDVLNARVKHPDSTLADLYDPRTMPPELLKAHHALDKAVMKLYGFGKDMAEAEIVAELMERYQELTNKRQPCNN